MRRRTITHSVCLVANRLDGEWASRERRDWNERSICRFSNDFGSLFGWMASECSRMRGQHVHGRGARVNLTQKVAHGSRSAVRLNKNSRFGHDRFSERVHFYQIPRNSSSTRPKINAFIIQLTSCRFGDTLTEWADRVLGPEVTALHRRQVRLAQQRSRATERAEVIQVVPERVARELQWRQRALALAPEVVQTAVRPATFAVVDRQSCDKYTHDYKKRFARRGSATIWQRWQQKVK